MSDAAKELGAVADRQAQIADGASVLAKKLEAESNAIVQGAADLAIQGLLWLLEYLAKRGEHKVNTVE